MVVKENWKKLNAPEQRGVQGKYILITRNAQDINVRLSAINFKKEHLYDIVLYSSTYFFKFETVSLIFFLHQT